MYLVKKYLLKNRNKLEKKILFDDDTSVKINECQSSRHHKWWYIHHWVLFQCMILQLIECEPPKTHWEHFNDTEENNFVKET